jgi:hypothetical protein
MLIRIMPKPNIINSPLMKPHLQTKIQLTYKQVGIQAQNIINLQQ